jgi:hypothetical protein
VTGTTSRIKRLAVAGNGPGRIAVLEKIGASR